MDALDIYELMSKTLTHTLELSSNALDSTFMQEETGCIFAWILETYDSIAYSSNIYTLYYRIVEVTVYSVVLDDKYTRT